MGPGESYTGLFGSVCTARWLLVRKTLNTGRGPYLRGPADYIMLRQYGAWTSAGVSVMHFMSWPQQLSFTYASVGAGPAHQSHIMGGCN